MKITNKVTKELLKQAQKAMQNAYAPYSGFSVGAAICDENDNIHGGCNVENAAYPLGVCAEGSAISQMVLSGGRIIKMIMLVSSGDQPVMPCGGCCQKIKEFCDDETKILAFHDNEVVVFSMNDLLPHAFSEDFLK